MARTLALLVLTAACAPPRAAPDDWPMWGGRPDRNMVSPATGLPERFGPADVRWSAELGDQTFGNPVVAGGRLFIGTNNGRPRDPSVTADRGVLMCFSAADGAFLWQALHEKLPTGEAEDWPNIGICSTPAVEGDRVVYVSNRAELVCRAAPTGRLLWNLDLRAAFGVAPYQASASSPLVAGGLVFVVTGHGRDGTTRTVKNPAAPSFIAVDAASGGLLWADASPGAEIVNGQWGSPAYGLVDGRPQVAFPGGDGRLYAFEPATGRRLWSFDAKGHEKPRGPDHLVATPVYAGGRILVATGNNPEDGDAPGCLRAVDARTGTELWRLEGKEFGRSISNVAVDGDLVYAAELGGYLDCVELETGRRLWRHDLLATVWGSPLVADGKVYIRTGDGDVVVLAAGRQAKVLGTSTLPGLSHGTVVAAGGLLYVAGEAKLYAVGPRPK
jgi:outer membrane protein assembly factor BamB